MARNQTMFFATSHDISIVMSQMESEMSLQYIETGLFETESRQVYLSYLDIPDFGKASHSTAVANPCYLFSRRGTLIEVEHVAQKTGGVLFAVDQLKNPNTVALRPGGKYGTGVILYGTVGTASHVAASREIYTFSTKKFRRSFTRQEEFLLGPEAAELWTSGVRLTIGAESPTEFDLKLPQSR